MEWNIFGILWYFLEKILIIIGICIGVFAIVSFLQKKFYKPQVDLEDESETQN
jgi:hypothetical protein